MLKADGTAVNNMLLCTFGSGQTMQSLDVIRGEACISEIGIQINKKKTNFVKSL